MKPTDFKKHFKPSNESFKPSTESFRPSNESFEYPRRRDDGKMIPEDDPIEDEPSSDEEERKRDSYKSGPSIGKDPKEFEKKNDLAAALKYFDQKNYNPKPNLPGNQANDLSAKITKLLDLTKPPKPSSKDISSIKYTDFSKSNNDDDEFWRYRLSVILV